jgi:hypothetical protein
VATSEGSRDLAAELLGKPLVARPLIRESVCRGLIPRVNFEHGNGSCGPSEDPAGLCPSWDVLSVMYMTDSVGGAHFLCVCFGKVIGEARSNQLITFTRFFDEALPVKYRDLPAAALNQTCAFQLSGSIRDSRPLNTQHFGEKALGDLQCVLVTAVTHHEQPTRQPLLEVVRAVARYRHQDLLEKGLNVSGHDISEGRHRLHRPREFRARHPGRAARDLDQKSDRGCLGAEEGLNTRGPLPTDRCHLNDAAVRINRDHRDDTAIRKEDMVERTVRVHQDLGALAANVFKVRHNPLEIAGGQGEQKPIAGPI